MNDEYYYNSMNLINLRDAKKNNIYLVTRAVLHTNTCNNIPELGKNI